MIRFLPLKIDSIKPGQLEKIFLFKNEYLAKYWPALVLPCPEQACLDYYHELKLTIFVTGFAHSTASLSHSKIHLARPSKETTRRRENVMEHARITVSPWASSVRQPSVRLNPSMWWFVHRRQSRSSLYLYPQPWSPLTMPVRKRGQSSEKLTWPHWHYRNPLRPVRQINPPDRRTCPWTNELFRATYRRSALRYAAFNRLSARGATALAGRR